MPLADGMLVVETNVLFFAIVETEKQLLLNFSDGGWASSENRVSCHQQSARVTV